MSLQVIKKETPGYPCCPYIVKRTISEDGLWVYAKVYVATALERGQEPSRIIPMLIATLGNLPIDSGITCPDFYQFGSTAEEICDYIITKSTVIPYTTCVAFYKKLDSSTTACRLCKDSRKYRNQNEDTEYAILHYMLQKETNLDRVLSKIGKDYFCSYMDVSLGIPVPKAQVIPMPKILVDGLQDKTLRAFLFSGTSFGFMAERTSPFDSLWDGVYSKFPRARKIPAVLTNNPAWANTLREEVRTRIESSVILTDEQVDKILNNYLREKERQGNNNDPLSMLTIEEVSSIIESEQHFHESDSKPSFKKESAFSEILPVEQLQENIIKESASEELPKRGDDTINVIPKTSSDEDPGVITTSQKIIDSDIKPNSITNKLSDEVSTCKKAVSTSEVLDKCPRNTKSNTDAEESPQTIVPAVGDSFPVDPDLHPSDEQIRLYLRKNLIICPTLSTEFISTYATQLTKESTLPDAFYHGVLRDGQLPIEICLTQEGDYIFLLWSRHMNRFLISLCKNSPDKLLELISGKRVEKLCYTPYLLYACGKKFQYAVKNVFSMQTAQGRAVPEEKEGLPYIDLIQSYSTSRPFGDVVEQKYYHACPFLGGMPTYRSLVKLQKQMLRYISNPVDLLNDLLFDEVLGSSYFCSRNFLDNRIMFALVGNRRFFFLEEFNRRALYPGKFISYSVSERYNALPMFRHVLCCLAEKGIFRKYNIQLIGLHKQILNLYIEESAYEYITSVMDLIFFEWGNNHREVSVDISCTIKSTFT